jgi:hypothetical protein
MGLDPFKDMKNSNCEGVWSVVFSGNNMEFFGVVILESGRLTGGDSNYTYSGYYNLKDGFFETRMLVKKYNQVFKTIMPDKYTVTLKGEYVNNKISLHGSPDECQEMDLNAVCTKQSELIPIRKPVPKAVASAA